VHGILSENDIDNAALALRSDLFQLWATSVAGRVENEFITPKKKIRKRIRQDYRAEREVVRVAAWHDF